MKLEEIQANTQTAARSRYSKRASNQSPQAKGQELQKTDETESFSRLWVEFLLTEAAAGEGRPPPTPTSPGQNNSLPGAPTLASPTKGLPPRRLSSFNIYAEGFLSALTSYLDTYGDDGKTHFNDAVTQSELAVAVNPLGDEGETISATVKDGVFVILFHHTRLGYSMGSLGDCLLAAIEAVLRPGFSLVAKHSIDEHYNAEIDELTQEIGNILNMPDVVLDPNFEENYAALAKAKKDDTLWQEAFGRAIFTYFSTGLRDQLTNQGFEGDEMMQEGFAEVVTSKTFRVRVVKATTNDLTNETILEDGVIYLQCTPERWSYSASNMGDGLVDLL
ncbi:hypothetical protein BD779DRAFT_1672232 [Infundibulicybe gibba]|nr:hypothetical protein BD779DRAFT_1672232 [Infundibulicybe gibba]